MIDHASGHCVGNWRLFGIGDERRIQCDDCAAHYPAAPENRLAAIDENYAGIYLRRLTAEGIAALGSTRRE